MALAERIPGLNRAASATLGLVDRFKRLKDNPYSRDKFGPGRAGDLAYVLLRSKETKCEFIGDPCKARPTRTLDYDWNGDGDRIPLCDEHLKPAMKAVRVDLQKNGRDTVFGYNGFGRA